MAPVSPADITANRLKIALARSQQLTSSWLPPNRDARTATERDEEEARVFTAEPELLGLGYKPSASAGDSFKLESMKQENDLRKRLLGKRKRQDPAALSTGSHGGSKPRPHKALQKEPPQEGSDEDEDGGRTMLGKSNRKASGTRYIEKGKMNQPGSSNMQTDGVDQQQFDVELNAKLRRPKSLLDEVLTQNAQKSSKRKDKKSKSKDMHSSHNLD